MGGKYKAIGCNSWERPQVELKAFKAMHAQAMNLAGISVKGVLPNSNRSPMRNNTRNALEWKRNTMNIVSNVLSCHQSVVIAMVSAAIRVQMALKSRCSGICSAKAESARFDIAYDFHQCGN